MKAKTLEKHSIDINTKMKKDKRANQIIERM